MNTFATISVISGIISAIIIATDLALHPQRMKIMNSVWVLTALWATIGALVLYFWFGRQKSPKSPKMPMGEMNMATMDMGHMQMAKTPKWQSSILSTLHCGAGCTLADLAGEWLVYLGAITIAGSSLLASTVIDYALALVIGVFFQYAAIRQMNRIAPKQALAKAAKADVLSLSAWQMGMYGFMALAIFVFWDGYLPRYSWTFWFMMQIAMLCGFVVALPVNLLLIKYGIKRAM